MVFCDENNYNKKISSELKMINTSTLSANIYKRKTPEVMIFFVMVVLVVIVVV